MALTVDAHSLYRCLVFSTTATCSMWMSVVHYGSVIRVAQERAVKFKWGNERAKLHDRLPPIKKNEKHMTWDFLGEIRINNYNTLIVLVSFSHKCVQGFYHRGFQKIYIKSIHFEF